MICTNTSLAHSLAILPRATLYCLKNMSKPHNYGTKNSNTRDLGIALQQCLYIYDFYLSVLVCQMNGFTENRCMPIVLCYRWRETKAIWRRPSWLPRVFQNPCDLSELMLVPRDLVNGFLKATKRREGRSLKEVAAGLLKATLPRKEAQMKSTKNGKAPRREPKVRAAVTDKSTVRAGASDRRSPAKEDRGRSRDHRLVRTAARSGTMNAILTKGYSHSIETSKPCALVRCT